MNVYKLIEEHTQKDPSHLAIKKGHEEISRARLLDSTNRLVEEFESHRVGESEIVLYYGGSGRPEFFYSLLACAKTGAVFLPLPKAMNEKDVLGIINTLRPRVILQFDIQDNFVREYNDKFEREGADQFDGGVIFFEKNDGLYYTPGTSLVKAAYSSALVQSIDDHSIILSTMPMNNLIGLAGQVLPGLLRGASLILTGRFDPEMFRQAIGNKATHTFLTLAQIKYLKKSGGWDALDFGHLEVITTGPGPVGVQLFQDIESKKGNLVSIYGTPHIARFVLFAREFMAPIPGSLCCLGTLAQDYHAKIEGGEILLKGPGHSHKLEFDHNASVRFAQAYWQHTGHRGEKKGDKLYFVGLMESAPKK